MITLGGGQKIERQERRLLGEGLLRKREIKWGGRLRYYVAKVAVWNRECRVHLRMRWSYV